MSDEKGIREVPDADTSDQVIRYSTRVLLALHNSPLVAKPADMPSISTWFGDDAEVPKNILNGTVTSRILANPIDKNIRLAPNKSVFSSPSYGKRTEDGKSSQSTQQHHSNRHRHNLHDSRLNNRDGKHMRKTTGQRSVSPSSNIKRNPHDRGGANRRDNRCRSGVGEQLERNGTHEKLPEWMDYTPPDQSVKNESLESVSYESDLAAASLGYDLEAWKSTMKQKDGLHKETVPASAPASQLPGSFYAVSAPEDKENIERMLKFDLQKMDVGSPSSLDMLSPLILDATATPSPVSRRERGSRFAKFFAKREEQDKQASASPPAPPGHGKSISVNELFQGTIGNVSTPENIPSAAQSTLSDIRMLSEEDVLRTLGAKKTSAATPPAENEKPEQDAMGFDKVLKILSQPKPTVPGATKDPSSSSAVQSPALSKDEPVDSNQPEKENVKNPKLARLFESRSAATGAALQSDDSVRELEPSKDEEPAATQKQQEIPQTNENIENAQSQQTPKTKLATNLFAGNLPTSVLRQMSARSSAGSPSTISHKSSKSLSVTGASPSSTHRSPVINRTVQQPQQQQQQQQQPSPVAQIQQIPGTLPYAPSPLLQHQQQQQPRYSPNSTGHQLPLGRPLEMAYSAGQGQQMAPPMPLSFGQGMPMMQPMPPPPHHMGGPMLPPFPPHVRPQFAPNSMPPPHMIPPQMLAKNQGWDRR